MTAPDWSKLEPQIVADLEMAANVAAKVKVVITAIKGSPLEPVLEKVLPGISKVETTALSDLDFLSSLDAKVIEWLNVLFPKAA